jgi:hypothetical protein
MVSRIICFIEQPGSTNRADHIASFAGNTASEMPADRSKPKSLENLTPAGFDQTAALVLITRQPPAAAHGSVFSASHRTAALVALRTTTLLI